MKARLLAFLACLLLVLGTPFLGEAQPPAPNLVVAMQQGVRSTRPDNVPPHSSTNDSGAGFWVVFIPVAAVVFLYGLARAASKDKTYNDPS
jgi:hypothetical protein